MASRTGCGTRPALAVPLVYQRLDEFHDALLAGRGGVQPAPHLDEAAINLLEAAIDLLEVSINLLEALINVIPQVDEILTEGVETGGGRVSKVTDLGPNLSDVAVGGTGEDSGGGRVLFDSLQPPPEVPEIVLAHSREPTAIRPG